ncbi:hypothetical protein ACFPOD_04725 [Nitratireductor kimnyeongensis]|uniref:Uncharacterized protein n=1 Tax=Nitratireductor kimnyeongensis TaxID=430679 RepID=A0ABW0T7H7_9HYPH|nr:hypothetical protein [Nitratireductor kimnyeongensis]QZZ34610.1 hypothetical protein KW403_12470 [Nitratireductor kimnyeongensis]
MNMRRYYAIRFRYKGKAECRMLSSDFLIESDASWHDVQREAQRVARETLMKQFSDIFPDSALSHLANPEYIEVVPGPCWPVVDGIGSLEKEANVNGTA